MSQTEIRNKKQLPSKKERHKLFGSSEPGPRTKPVEKEQMVDLQNSKQDFLFKIDTVGISNVKHPIRIPSTRLKSRQLSARLHLAHLSPRTAKGQT